VAVAHLRLHRKDEAGHSRGGVRFQAAAAGVAGRVMSTCPGEGVPESC